MKKIMFFVFSFALCTNILNGAAPFHYPESNFHIILPDFSPHYPGFFQRLILPNNASAKICKAHASLSSNGLITERDKSIHQVMNQAEDLINHGQKTYQLGSFENENERSLIFEILTCQLMQLNIEGVDDKGNLAPELSVLNDFFIHDKEKHQIVPLHSLPIWPLCHVVTNWISDFS